MGHPLRAALLALALLAAGCAAPLGADERAPSTAASPRAVVVSSNPLAAEAGAAMLRAGGNAIDAAAAVAFALTVVEPHFSGIGGGGFILVRAANGSAVVIDGRETAPAASTPDQFLLPGGAPMPVETAHMSGLAVGVPGMVAAWERALATRGTMTLAEVLEPARRYADEGFPVDRYLAANLEHPFWRAKLMLWPASAQQFYHGVVCPPETPLPGVVPCAGGTAYAEGDTLRQPDLARSLALLQAQGARVFYEGEIAPAIVAAVAKRDGRMSVDDLADYAAVEREPLRMPYRDMEVLTTPPPSGGVIVAQMLGILEPLDVGASGHHSGEALHLTIEAMHLAYADRGAYLGDPAFVHVPVAGMLHPDYLAERRALIGERANPDVAPGDPARYEGKTSGARRADASDLHRSAHTSHLLVVDLDGNVVSATMTVESIFGNGMVVPGYGFILNNELTDFNFEPGGANEVAPGKRPRSAMSPTIVLQDGAPILVGGASGGPTIIASVFQVIQNALEHSLDLATAVSAGRIYSPEHGTRPYDVEWDRDVPAEARDDLAARGHSPQPASLDHLSQVEFAMLVDGSWVGAADTRAAAGGVVYVDAEEE